MNNLVISSVGNSVFLNGLGSSNLQNLPIPEGVKSLYWDDVNNTGWLENLDSEGNYVGNTNITTLPSWANQCVDIFKTATTPSPIPAKELCKLTARQLLADTDYTELPSVSNPQYTPHLLNYSEFITYRVTVREYVTNPVDNPVWPTKPTAQWSN
jgi:hypothetical protein